MSLSQLRVGLLFLLSMALTATPSLTTGEYFFDSDPGLGQGTAFSFTADSTLDQTFSLDVSTLELGWHDLYVRFLDDSSHWSLTNSQHFYIAPIVSSESPVNLSSFEYFIGEDPGVGLANQVPLNGSNTADDIIQIAMTNLGTGFHHFSFRTRDDLAQWGLTESVFIRVDNYLMETMPNLATMEYSLDNGTTWSSISISPASTDIDQMVNIPIPGGLDPDTSLTFWTQVRDVWGYPSLRSSLSFGLNHAPIAANDSISLDEDSSLEILVLSNDTDPDQDSLIIFSVSDAHNGNASFGDGDSLLLYTPHANFFGADSFSYTVTDLLGDHDSAMVFVQVMAINDAPGFLTLLSPTSDTTFTQSEDSLITFTWGRSHDVDGDLVEYQLIFAADTVILETDPGTDTSLVFPITELPRGERLSWYVAAHDTGLTTYSDTFNITIDAIVALDDKSLLPDAFSLNQNYPNPFNPSTTISYTLPSFAHATLRIYDVTGRVITTLSDNQQDAGFYNIQWAGRDDSGRSVSTGVYFVRLQAEAYSKTIKMVYLK